MQYLTRVLGLSICIISLSIASRAQVLPDSTDTPLIIREVAFVGQTVFPETTLQLQTRVRPNRKLLGISGVTPWLWFYRWGAGGKLGTGLSRALMQSGEPPALLDLTVVSDDAERLQLFFQQEGFRAAQVRAQVDTLAEEQQARVTYHIEAGPPTFLRHVRYEGLTGLDRAQRRRLLQGSVLLAQAQRADTTGTMTFRMTDTRYSEPLLGAEGRHLLSFLRDEGYAQINRDSVRAAVATPTPDSFDVTFRIKTGRRYRFGDVHFTVRGPETSSPTRIETLIGLDEAPHQVTVQIENEGLLKPALLREMLQFQPGEWYSRSKILDTKRRLEDVGIFTFTDVTSASVQDTEIGQVPLISHRFELRTRPRHRFRFEGFMLRRDGVYSGEEIGVGVGGAYQNLNLRGQGEIFQFRPSFSFSPAFDANFFSGVPYQGEATVSIIQPYLMFPFRGLERRWNLYATRTRISVSFLTARRKELIIRGRGALNFRLELDHSPTTTSLIDILDLNLSDPDTTAGFSDAFLSRLSNRPFLREQILEDYSRPQINSAFRYTLRSSTSNPLRRERGYWREFTLELGGHIPYLLDTWVYTPDQVEGSIPGIGGRSNRLIYRPYIQAQFDLRQYKPLGNTNTSIFAWRVSGGFSQPLYQARVIPFDRRFFVGGPWSIRGWGLRELGPGATDPADNAFIQGGDIILEASLELRNIVLRNFWQADWSLALFVDAGNVWFGPRNPGDAAGKFHVDRFYREIAISNGFGFRIAWEYLIARFDWGLRIYDPFEGFVGLQSPQFHFSFGHAF